VARRLGRKLLRLLPWRTSSPRAPSRSQLRRSFSGVRPYRPVHLRAALLVQRVQHRRGRRGAIHVARQQRRAQPLQQRRRGRRGAGLLAGGSRGVFSRALSPSGRLRATQRGRASASARWRSRRPQRRQRPRRPLRGGRARRWRQRGAWGSIEPPARRSRARRTPQHACAWRDGASGADRRRIRRVTRHHGFTPRSRGCVSSPWWAPALTSRRHRATCRGG